MEKNKLAVKRVIKTVVAVFAALAVVLGVLYLISSLIKGDKVDYTEKDASIYYFSADYDADPLDDEVYAEKSRGVYFTDMSGLGEYLTEADSSAPTARGLFYRYFSALMNGDAASHRSLLSDDYADNFTIQERFTPQKVYDISVSFLSGDSEDGTRYERYSVAYKIYKNDGTYRADVGSDTAKNMVFELVYGSGSMPLINSIVPNLS